MQTKNPVGPIEKLIVSAAKKGVTITPDGPNGWALVNTEGQKGTLTRQRLGGYVLQLDGYEADEAQYGEDAYTREHAWTFGALCHAVAHLR